MNKDLRMQVMLASIICHLAEHIESGEPADLQAAEGLLTHPDVRELFRDARKHCLLPLPRRPVKMLELGDESE